MYMCACVHVHSVNECAYVCIRKCTRMNVPEHIHVHVDIVYSPNPRPAFVYE